MPYGGLSVPETASAFSSALPAESRRACQRVRRPPQNARAGPSEGSGVWARGSRTFGYACPRTHRSLLSPFPFELEATRAVLEGAVHLSLGSLGQRPSPDASRSGGGQATGPRALHPCVARGPAQWLSVSFANRNACSGCGQPCRKLTGLRPGPGVTSPAGNGPGGCPPPPGRNAQACSPRTPASARYRGTCRGPGAVPARGGSEDPTENPEARGAFPLGRKAEGASKRRKSTRRKPPPEQEMSVWRAGGWVDFGNLDCPRQTPGA